MELVEGKGFVAKGRTRSREVQGLGGAQGKEAQAFQAERGCGTPTLSTRLLLSSGELAEAGR